MLCEVPLTKEQQEFAAEHHGLVYKFLNDNHLSEDEFYDVVIFPYLTAVRDYCNSSSAQKYSFSTIAMRQMKFRLCDYFRAQERHKRNAEILSIHLGLYPDGTPLENTLAVQDKLMQEFEMGQLLHDLAGSHFQTADEHCPYERLRLWRTRDCQKRKAPCPVYQRSS